MLRAFDITTGYLLLCNIEYLSYLCFCHQIHRNKNKWKFHLKDGIMNLRGKDYVFQKSNGDAEW